MPQQPPSKKVHPRLETLPRHRAALALLVAALWVCGIGVVAHREVALSHRASRSAEVEQIEIVRTRTRFEIPVERSLAMVERSIGP